MKRSTYIGIAVAVVVIAIFVVFYVEMMPAPVATTPSIPTVPIAPQATGTPVISVTSAFFSQETNATLGTYLTDNNGRTLYTYTADTANTSNCTGGCAAIWPPYGPPSSGNGIVNLPMLPANVGVIQRSDGTSQFTWKGMPLYYYAKDTASGATNGQGVGGSWFVVTL